MFQKFWMWVSDLFTSYSLCKIFFKLILNIRKSDIIAGLSYAAMITEVRELTVTFGIYRSEELQFHYQA